MKSLLKLLASIFGLLILLILGYLFLNYYSDLPVDDLKKQYTNEYSQFVEVDGMQVHYQRKGKGHPLVLVHGFSGHVWNWREWMEHLPNDFELIAMDLPGFGLTGPHPDGDYSTEMSVDFLDKFLTKIGVDTFHLAGNSMGGGISWAYTLAHPERVKKLVLVDASGYPKKDSKTIAGFKILQYPILHPLITKITPKSILEKSLAGTYVDQSYANEEEINLYHNMLRRTGNRQVLIDRMKVPRKDKSHLIKNIKTPTLIIWGKEDIIIPVDNAYLFQRDIEGSELIVYDQVGHLPMDEVGERSAKDVRNFLNL